MGSIGSASRVLMALIVAGAFGLAGGGAMAKNKAPGPPGDGKGKAGEDHGKAGEDHGKAGEDQGKAGEDQGKAGEDHGKAGEDHGKAGEDHGKGCEGCPHMGPDGCNCPNKKDGKGCEGCPHRKDGEGCGGCPNKKDAEGCGGCPHKMQGDEAGRPEGAGLERSDRLILGKETGAAKRGPTAEEQRKHVKRIASIKRLLEVAAETGDAQLEEKVKGLEKKERERHGKAMAKRHARGKGKVKP
jgi:hypothetical protein